MSVKIEKEKAAKEVVQNFTYAEIEELSNALTRLKNENIAGSCIEAKMVNISNRRRIKPFVEAIVDVRELPSGYEEYRKKIYAVQEQHAQKAEDTSIQYFRVVDGVEVKVFDKNETNYAKWIDPVAYGKEYKAINEEYKGVIALVDENPKVVKTFMASVATDFPRMESLSTVVTNEAALKTVLNKIPEDILDVLCRFGIVDLKTT